MQTMYHKRVHYWMWMWNVWMWLYSYGLMCIEIYIAHVMSWICFVSRVQQQNNTQNIIPNTHSLNGKKGKLFRREAQAKLLDYKKKTTTKRTTIKKQHNESNKNIIIISISEELNWKPRTRKRSSLSFLLARSIAFPFIVSYPILFLFPIFRPVYCAFHGQSLILN